jgi:hypothetical protein
MYTSGESLVIPSYDGCFWLRHNEEALSNFAVGRGWLLPKSAMIPQRCALLAIGFLDARLRQVACAQYHRRQPSKATSNDWNVGGSFQRGFVDVNATNIYAMYSLRELRSIMTSKTSIHNLHRYARRYVLYKQPDCPE